jgi:glucose-1-phosphate cytidylyltransferase
MKKTVKKLVILAGGLGTRISEETQTKPKPMIEIGGMPILWHIMKFYSCFGINEFIICCGYKGYIIKDYFANYFTKNSDVTFDMSNNSVIVHHTNVEKWKITLIDTGEISQTGGRLKRVKNFVEDEDAFCFTYGDGLSNVDINTLINFHFQSNLLATLTAVQPPGRFGALKISNNNIVEHFNEKPAGDGAYINGGFFILSPKVIDLIEGDDTVWEDIPLSMLAKNKQLGSYIHSGFWQPMDTHKDKTLLEQLWDSGNPPWKLWD